MKIIHNPDFSIRLNPDGNWQSYRANCQTCGWKAIAGYNIHSDNGHHKDIAFEFVKGAISVHRHGERDREAIVNCCEGKIEEHQNGEII